MTGTERKEEYTTRQAAELAGLSFRTATVKAHRLNLGRVVAGVRFLTEQDVRRLALDGRKKGAAAGRQ